MKMWPHISQEKKFEDKLKRGREKGGTRSSVFQAVLRGVSLEMVGKVSGGQET